MTARRVWITGAGSGVGAATAERLARAGHEVVISGRRRERLEEVARRIESAGGTALVAPLDVADPAAVTGLVEAIGRIDVLVASAGHNIPARHWDGLDLEGFDDVIAVNLTALGHCVAAVLPGMRRAGGGQIVVISSRAAFLPAPQSGPAYRASKAGAGALVQTINGELFSEGVRATHLCPGDIATEFLDLRPSVPDESARALMLSADDVARTVELVVQLPERIRVDELVVTSAAQW